MPKPIIRYENAYLRYDESTGQFEAVIYKQGVVNEVHDPKGITLADSYGRVSRFETEEAIYVEVK